MGQMIKKVLIFLTSILCASVFLLPARVQAGGGETTVVAWINGESMHIEVWGGQTGPEAVFINDIRINYRALGAFEVPARSCAGTGEYITVYAVDGLGNYSNTFVIDNPYYIVPASRPAVPYAAPKPTPEPTTSVVPEDSYAPVVTESGVPSEGNPFSVKGEGTVLDNAVEGDGKEFFTIDSAEGNEFFLIVDRQRAADNVYLLNTVTENDLLALAEKSGVSLSSIPTPPHEPLPTAEPAPSPTPEPEQSPITQTNNSGSILVIVLAVLGAGGAGYYFKIVKPRQNAPSSDDDDDDDNYDEDYSDDVYNGDED